VAEGKAQPTKATPIMSLKKGGKTAGPPIFSGPAYGTYTVPAFGRWHDGHLRQYFLFSLFLLR